MNGELAGLIVLISNGNGFIHNYSVPTEIFNSNKVFQYDESITFAKKTGDEEEVITWDATKKWFEYLISRGVKRLRLISFNEENQFPPHILAAFVGGGTWAIEVEYSHGYEIWIPTTTKTPNNFEKAKKTWDVTFDCISSPHTCWINHLNIEESTEKLSQALLQAKSFAEKTPYFFWVEWFAKALMCLEESNIDEDFDLLPNIGYSLEARQLMFCAKKAWAFGGMGTWNDLYFDKEAMEKEYHDVTEQLYEAVITACLISTNSFVV